MRIIEAETIINAIVQQITRITYHCDPEVLKLISSARDRETDVLGKDVLEAILQNNQLAAETHIPLCQDTGTTVIFAELGHEVLIAGACLQELTDEAIRRAQSSCPLRASIVKEPLFDRNNTQDNSPVVLHLSQVRGDTLRLRIAQKGGGAENMSFLTMFSPAADFLQIGAAIVEGVLLSGSKACPPLIIGIGIGGNFERCAILAKQALLEPLGRLNHHPDYAELEQNILQEVNQKGSGAQGLGGSLTALAVHILHEPCHIASLPVAVNLQCHAHRHAEIVL